MEELTEKEQIYYANYGYIQECQLCKNEYPIHKYDIFNGGFNKNYIEFNGKQFLCVKCLE